MIGSLLKWFKQTFCYYQSKGWLDETFIWLVIYIMSATTELETNLPDYWSHPSSLDEWVIMFTFSDDV